MCDTEWITMERVVPTTLGTMVKTGMRRWFESRFGFRGLTLRRGLATVFCFTLNRYQTVSALISFACFCYAYYQFLEMNSTQKLLRKKNSTNLHVGKEILAFVVGAIGWRIWMSALRVLSRWERALRPYEHGGIGKLIVLVMRTPGMTISPIIGAYICPHFTDVAGTHLLCALACSTFFIQLTHPCEGDFGSVDMFEGIHLPMLPQLKLKLKDVIVTSCIYYSRKYAFLGVEESIKWLKRRGQPEPQQAVQPENIAVAQEHANTNDLQHLKDLAQVTTEFLTMARTKGLFVLALVVAGSDGAINHDTRVEFLGKFNDMAHKVDEVNLHLGNLSGEV